MLHSYTSGWVDADFIPDPPVPGAMEFLHAAIAVFDVRIFSSRSHQEGGIRAMSQWVEYWARKQLGNNDPDWKANAVVNAIVHNRDGFPKEKPPAFVTLDDRALTFTGVWPDMETLRNFKPWNK